MRANLSCMLALASSLPPWLSARCVVGEHSDRRAHRPCAGAFETPDINSVDLKPIIDKKCHVNCHHAWEEYEKCEKRIEAKESGDCASWYMDYLKCSMVKVASWRCHSWPPRAYQAEFEGFRLPSALVRRGPALQIPPRGRVPRAPPRQTHRFRCV